MAGLAQSTRFSQTGTVRSGLQSVPRRPAYISIQSQRDPVVVRHRSSCKHADQKFRFAPRIVGTQRCRAVVSATKSVAAGGSDSNLNETDDSNFIRVTLPTALALLLCNMDRICLSVAILSISKDLSWTPSVQGLVQSAFLWGYMATQIVGGTLADKYGGKTVLGFGIAWFSVASLLLPCALSPPVIAAGLAVPGAALTRMLVGLGEGVALPAMNNMVAKYIPNKRRATALGTVFTGFHSGNILGLILSPIILAKYGWQSLFYIFGTLGLPLLLLWATVVPPQPKNGNLNSQNRVISPVGVVVQRKEATLKNFVATPAVLAIIVVNFINHWGYFIYLNWMPSYFYQVFGLNLKTSSLLSILPWVVMAVGSSAAGIIADTAVLRGVDVTTVRKSIQTVAFTGPALALLVLSSTRVSPPMAVTCFTAALGVSSLGQAGFVAAMSDVAPNNAGQLFGLCNTFGSLAGILGTAAAGFIVEKTGSFNILFQATAVLYILGVIMWNKMCVARQLFF